MKAGLRGRFLAGAIGGIVGTAAMTAAMRRLHRRLPADEQYPLPPREISEKVAPGLDEERERDLTVLTHFGFGTLSSAVLTSACAAGPVGGGLWGLVVWSASYFGWLPSARILQPATSHPVRRNRLMILVHLVWGATSALAAREILAARDTIFAQGPLRDVHPVGDRPD